MNNKIYIIIPVHNRKEFTKGCLLSLRAQTFKDFKIVVIDDGSTDGTVEMLKYEFPEVQILEGDGTLWWTTAINLGIKYALVNNAEYILTLNNDTVANEKFLENLMKYASPCIIQGALWKDDQNNIVDGGTKKIIWTLDISEKIKNTLSSEEVFGLKKITHYSGRGLFIHKSIFSKIGLFDSKYFPHYYADTDFTMRAIKKGIRIYINYDAILNIFQEESWSKRIKKMRSIRGYLLHLFSIKGGGNIKNFYRLSFRHCPKRYLIPNLFIGSVRRIFGYWM